MAGIYIAGMQMPKSCVFCDIRHENVDLLGDIISMRCPLIALYKSYIGPNTGRLPDCPLIAVPDHGRLIDADALREAVGKVEAARRQEYCALSEAEKECEYEQGVWDGVHMVAKMISVAPTVIPVDKEAAE